MEIFAKLESWDYLAAAMLLFWLRALCIWPAAICSCNIGGS